MIRFSKNLMFGLMVIAWSSAYGQNGAGRTLSLDEALALAEQNSYQVRIAQSQLAAAEGQSLEGWSGFLPHVSAGASYVRSNDPVTVFSFKLKQGVFTQNDLDLPSLNRPEPLHNFATRLEVQQPVLNLDAIYGKAAAGLAVKARSASLMRTQKGVALQVKKAYYGLVLAREHLELLTLTVRSAERHRDDARAALEQGLINQADFLAAEVRLAELREQRIVAEHELANASDALKFVLGLEEAGLVVPSDTIPAPVDLPAAPSEATGVGQRGDLQALLFQTQAAQRNLWRERSAWMPRLNAFAALEWNDTRAFSTVNSNWTVGVQLQWRLFQGLGNFGRSKQASAQAQERAVRLRQAEEQARLEVRRAERAVQAAQQRLELTESAVQQAEESLRIAEERFRQGLEKTADLLSKEVARTRARLRALQARYDYAIAVSELAFARGDGTN